MSERNEQSILDMIEDAYERRAYTGARMVVVRRLDDPVVPLWVIAILLVWITLRGEQRRA